MVNERNKKESTYDCRNKICGNRVPRPDFREPRVRRPSDGGRRGAWVPVRKKRALANMELT